MIVYYIIFQSGLHNIAVINIIVYYKLNIDIYVQSLKLFNYYDYNMYYYISN